MWDGLYPPPDTVALAAILRRFMYPQKGSPPPTALALPALASRWRVAGAILCVLAGLLCVGYGNVVFGGRSLVYTSFPRDSAQADLRLWTVSSSGGRPTPRGAGTEPDW